MARSLTIRMYNVGFGDAFLVLIPDGKKQRKILFDCGSIEAASNAPMRSIVERILKDVTDDDDVARIDVVVATHRHKDHVSGFGIAAWDEVEVGEVWMPWTEDPRDPTARRIRDAQSRLALGLKAALTGLAAAPDVERCRDMVDNALFLSNDKAMKVLHGGFRGNPLRRFLPEKGRKRRSWKSPVLPGVTVHVLGPSRDEDVIRDMEPAKGESYLRIRDALGPQANLPPAPFSPDLRVPATMPTPILSDPDKDDIESAGSLSELAAAVALDKAVNGTSLMLILEIAGTCLLFPGDAQWGTWNAVLQDEEWRELLQRISFYKVGHHGSHNATPPEFVEELIPSKLLCMASTLRRDVWPDIPRKPLLKALAEKKARIARSDKAAQVDAPFTRDGDVIELTVAL